MPYRAGVVGFGRVGRNHAEAYRAVDGLELVALAERDAELLAELGSHWGVPEAGRYCGLQALLANEYLDVVSIATPAHLHSEHVRAIAEAADPPRAIWCEKPIAETVADADAMVAACESAGIELVLNHNRRFTNAHRALRDAIRDGFLGELETVHQIAGRSLLGVGTHFVDLLVFLLDAEPIAVRGGTTIRLRDGPRVVVDMVDRAKMASLRTYLFGSDGGFSFPLDRRGRPSVHWKVDDDLRQVTTDPPFPFDELWAVDTAGTHSTYDPSQVAAQRSFELAAEHLVRLLDGVEPNHSSGRNAITGLEILAGMAITGDTGGAIDLPLAARFRHTPIELS